MSKRDTFLPFSKPDLGHAESMLIQEVLTSGWLTTGSYTHRFEESFAEHVGAKHAVAVNSCTAALHLALEAIGLRPGDEVITTPYTFASTAEVVRYFGAQPRFVDIDRETLNIDPEAVASAIGPRARALLPVHFAGHPADMGPLDELARTHGLDLIEDAAHSLPAKYRGTSIGARRPAIGESHHLVCYSFYATKTMTTGEGGMICTDEEALADRCRVMSLHGISRDAWKRYSSEGSWYYEITAPGFKYNLTDIAAALGLAQLARLDEMAQKRSEIASLYSEAFATRPELSVPASREDIEHAWHLYTLRLNLDRLTIDRNGFVEELRARNIGTSVHFIPLHIHPYYRDVYGFKPSDFPVAYAEYLREVSLPIYSAMSQQDIDDVVQAVTDIVTAFRA